MDGQCYCVILDADMTLPRGWPLGPAFCPFSLCRSSSKPGFEKLNVGSTVAFAKVA